MAVALALEKISKSFGSTEVLHDINLQVDDGEFVVFVGPSGCGKSTLLRIIAGLEDATTGSVAIAGKQVTTLPPAEREISMVFQTYALYPHLTVRGNLELGLKQAKRPAAHIAEQVAAATQMLELEPYLKRRPAELSGGQRQRVAIGRAIVRKPRLFLFDEPLSNLDAALRANTRLEIARLHNELASSMVYVTHDQVEAMTLADRIVVLRAGRIEQIGTPMDLYNDPDNMFVASFLGIPNINFLPASMLGIADAKTVGLRPEHISLSSNPGKLAGTVSHVEQLGGDTNVYLQIEGEPQLTVRLFGQHRYDRNAKLGIDFEQDKLLRFDDKSMRQR